jgi:hypothetical protein
MTGAALPGFSWEWPRPASSMPDENNTPFFTKVLLFMGLF